ncbi:hypothetical protein [Candidatus Contendibacter odensensis]|uniref:Uncharacterized protein n=1 Tax=Candidatus Contendobacter odensis Run_B_J11 TaxID=1400861 RepID=A0A7U7J4J9_9GAMM|nr:hypothetical protein [Candidatus Contendobacter odensis]CDH45321.1 hypothetical protein BN874_2210009 [Candidatus Contendobacter odensis Run_B_J11]
MQTIVDLEQVKRTRIELADVVKRHPELCQGEGRWSDNLDALEDGIMATGKQRMEKYRAKEKGLKAVNVFLTPEAQETLAAIMAEHPNLTMGEIISEALTTLITQSARA